MSPSGAADRGALFDARGCLTPAGFAALGRAPVGRGPADLAAHVAACARCQERMLAGTPARAPSPPASRRRKPRLWLGLALAFAALLLSLAALMLAARLR